MITDRIGRHEVLLQIYYLSCYNKVSDIGSSTSLLRRGSQGFFRGAGGGRRARESKKYIGGLGKRMVSARRSLGRWIHDPERALFLYTTITPTAWFSAVHILFIVYVTNGIEFCWKWRRPFMKWKLTSPFLKSTLIVFISIVCIGRSLLKQVHYRWGPRACVSHSNNQPS